jgi:hypothetical protein
MNCLQDKMKLTRSKNSRAILPLVAGVVLAANATRSLGQIVIFMIEKSSSRFSEPWTS